MGLPCRFDPAVQCTHERLQARVIMIWQIPCRQMPGRLSDGATILLIAGCIVT